MIEQRKISMIKIIKKEKGSEDKAINDQVDNNNVVNTDWSEIFRQVYIERTDEFDALVANFPPSGVPLDIQARQSGPRGLKRAYIEQTNARDMLIIDTDAVNLANFGPEPDMLHLLIKYSD
jgi:hypothetical protein